eukprot:5112960-Pleurochrysis_carterae.AAC.3
MRRRSTAVDIGTPQEHQTRPAFAHGSGDVELADLSLTRIGACRRAERRRRRRERSRSSRGLRPRRRCAEIARETRRLLDV